MGYAYEAVVGVMQFFRSNPEVKGFIYEADRRNPSSIRLVRKLEGVEVDYQEVPGENGKMLELKKYLIV